MRVRDSNSACTRTAFLSQVDTETEPAKFLTSRRAPDFTVSVVSRRPEAITVPNTATPSNNMGSPLALRARERRGSAQQVELELHLQGKMLVKVRARRVGRQRPPRLDDRPIDDGKILFHDPHRRGVQLGAVRRERVLELGDRLVVIGIESGAGQRG